MSFIVTGTDTGVGKTSVATALALGLKTRGHRVAPMKPVQTGCEPGRHCNAPDLDFALTLLDQTFEPEMLPYAYDPPCSPHLAAARANQPIELHVITDAFTSLQTRYEQVVVEGAGGVLVPLNDKEMMLDLMVALDLPVVLAARPALGTLNHTLLSLHVLRDAGLTVSGFVTVDTQPSEWTFIEENNLTTLITCGKLPHLAHIPFAEPLDAAALTAIGLQLAETFEA